MLRPFAHPVACWWEFIAQSLKPVKLLATCKRTQQLPTLMGVVRQQCCVRWHGALHSRKLTLPADGRAHFQGGRVRSYLCFEALVSGHPEFVFSCTRLVTLQSPT